MVLGKKRAKPWSAHTQTHREIRSQQGESRNTQMKVISREVYSNAGEGAAAHSARKSVANEPPRQ